METGSKHGSEKLNSCRQIIRIINRAYWIDAHFRNGNLNVLHQ